MVGCEGAGAPSPSTPPWSGLQLLQYLYRAEELRPLLAAAGFELLWDRGYGVHWALLELPLIQTLSRWLRGPILQASSDYWDRVPQAPWAQEPLMPIRVPRSVYQLLRRLLTLEVDGFPLLGALPRPPQSTASNIRLCVCRRPAGRQG